MRTESSDSFSTPRKRIMLPTTSGENAKAISPTMFTAVSIARSLCASMKPGGSARSPNCETSASRFSLELSFSRATATFSASMSFSKSSHRCFNTFSVWILLPVPSASARSHATCTISVFWAMTRPPLLIALRSASFSTVVGRLSPVPQSFSFSAESSDRRTSLSRESASILGPLAELQACELVSTVKFE